MPHAVYEVMRRYGVSTKRQAVDLARRHPARAARRVLMILIDTSARIEYFRATGSPAAVEVRRLLSSDTDRIVMCEPVAMEILAGAVDDDRYAKLERLVNGVQALKIDDAVDFRSAAAITGLVGESFR
ncbi:PIN domain-containing protein [Mycolicibacterium sp.]|uniref:PIN domain-containing protein n=1 Tax=Mycolicibacterium sp. TaxID=2320850 RepID=UPI0025CED9FE|nr:PIN domain-containing protein [Mycolicibacterium sp.]